MQQVRTVGGEDADAHLKRSLILGSCSIYGDWHSAVVGNSICWRLHSKKCLPSTGTLAASRKQEQTLLAACPT